jgi:hypothetical protein
MRIYIFTIVINNLNEFFWDLKNKKKNHGTNYGYGYQPKAFKDKVKMTQPLQGYLYILGHM